MRRRLHESAAWALLGSGVLNLCRLGVVVLLARTAPPEVLGAFLYCLALTSPLLLFGQFELRAVLVADPRPDPSLRDYLRARNFGLWLVLAPLVALGAWEAWRGATPATLWLLAGVAFGRFAWNLSELAWGVWQRRDAWPAVAGANILRGVLMLAPFALLAAFSAATIAGAATSAWAMALGWLAAHLFFERRALRTEQNKPAEPPIDANAPAPQPPDRGVAAPPASGVGAILLRGLPLALVQVVIVLCDSLPRLFVAGAERGGLRELGYFGALAQLALVANLALIAVSTAASRRLTLHFHGDRAAFRRLTLRLLLLAGALGAAVLLVVFVLGAWLLEQLFLPAYAEHSSAFLRLMAAQCLLLPASVLGFVVTSAGRFWVQLPLHAIVLIATGVACWAWIPADPVNGAASAGLVRAAVHTLLYAGCAAVLLAGAPDRADAPRAEAMPDRRE